MDVAYLHCRQKIQHGGDWERSRPQGPKNAHNFLMTVRPLIWACGHGTEMLLILKTLFLTWLGYSPIFSDMTVQINVPRFCTRSICGWNLFQPLGLLDYNTVETRKSDHLWDWLKVVPFWNRSDLWNQPIMNGEILDSLFIDIPCYVLIRRSYWIWREDILKNNTQLKKVVLNAYRNIWKKTLYMGLYLFL